MPNFEFENLAIAKGFVNICGVDEAGRGPLAGPVCAAAVILPNGVVIEGLDDSKKVSEKKREVLYNKIIDVSLSWSVAMATVEEIEQYNILNATFIAMRRAVDALKIKADYVLIDGNRTPPDLQIPCCAVIKGDSKSMSIAAASIIAKVTRDRLIVEYDKKFPGYGFAAHKGYGTRRHYEAIKELGICEIHRKSFLKGVI